MAGLTRFHRRITGYERGPVAMRPGVDSCVDTDQRLIQLEVSRIPFDVTVNSPLRAEPRRPETTLFFSASLPHRV